MPSWLDERHRQIGRSLDALGLGPQEAPSRIAAEMPGARLRAYHERESGAGPALLILPAPFKRAYVWDLLPEVSVVRRCLARGMRVYLLDWHTLTSSEDGFGLADYADRMPLRALEIIAEETGSQTPLMAGHSLGGTFAAIFAALYPERVGGLLLVDAPLAFGEDGGPLADAVRMIPHAGLIRLAFGSPVPGSVINALSLAAAPDAFALQPALDLAVSMSEPLALAVHTRVARWAVDEFPLPGRLFEEVLEELYRKDRFRSGSLVVGGRRAGATRLQAPVLAVVNPIGQVVPPTSVLRGLEIAPDLPVQVLTYEGGHGPLLQHLGPLVAPAAHVRLWPEILDWAVAHQAHRSS